MLFRFFFVYERGSGAKSVHQTLGANLHGRSVEHKYEVIRHKSSAVIYRVTIIVVNRASRFQAIASWRESNPEEVRNLEKKGRQGIQ